MKTNTKSGAPATPSTTTGTTTEPLTTTQLLALAEKLATVPGGVFSRGHDNGDTLPIGVWCNDAARGIREMVAHAEGVTNQLHAVRMEFVEEASRSSAPTPSPAQDGAEGELLELRGLLRSIRAVGDDDDSFGAQQDAAVLAERAQRVLEALATTLSERTAALAEATARAERLEDALAKRCLADMNAARENPNDWPAGQEWDDLVGSSQSIFRRRAREEAGLAAIASASPETPTGDRT